ncbi:MAG TPA: PLDc N-terminal domain-containing protein [Gaiellaceae bacterium]|nr:PLDc N-terminal domain-containing protein [Gaiellaceae bacterium]
MEYPFLDLVWTLLVVFAWAIWFWLLISVHRDIFRRRDLSGGRKVLWSIFTIVFPYVGVFAYMFGNHDGMAERNAERAHAFRAELDDLRRRVTGSGGAAVEIEKAKGLLDSGAIDQREFDAIKHKALTAS